MDMMQAAMLICATALLVTTGVLLIIRTMPSRDGIGWWVLAATLQFSMYALGTLFFKEDETAIGQIVFFALQMAGIQAVGIGMFQYIDKDTNVLFRLLLLVLSLVLMASLMVDGNKTAAIWVFVLYVALNAFSTTWIVLRSEHSMFWLKAAALFLSLIGLHYLDYPLLINVEWFAPIGFLLGLVFAIGLFFSLATVSLLQFKKITNDSEQKAIRAAIHDPLTDLYNRSHLETLYSEYKALADQGNESFVMLYIDLDGFKTVNDTYGHKAGDVILIVVAKRLSNWLAKKGDAIRIGGDELVVLNRLRSGENTTIIHGTSAAQSVLGLLEQPIIDGENVYEISGSIGACYYDPEFCCLDDMLSKADGLMYDAKKSGGRRVLFDEGPKQVSTSSVQEPQKDATRKGEPLEV